MRQIRTLWAITFAAALIGLTARQGGAGQATAYFGVTSNLGYISTQWYPPTNTPAATQTIANDTIYCTPIKIEGSPAVAKALGVDVTAAGTGASVKIAIYATDSTTRRPGAKLQSTAGISISGTGAASATITTQALFPGIYWGCSLYTSTSAPTVVATQTGNITGASVIMGGGGVASAIGSGYFNGISYNVGGLYTSGFPSTLVNLGSDVTQVPMVAWQQN